MSGIGIKEWQNARAQCIFVWGGGDFSVPVEWILLSYCNSELLSENWTQYIGHIVPGGLNNAKVQEDDDTKMMEDYARPPVHEVYHLPQQPWEEWNTIILGLRNQHFHILHRIRPARIKFTNFLGRPMDPVKQELHRHVVSQQMLYHFSEILRLLLRLHDVENQFWANQRQVK